MYLPPNVTSVCQSMNQGVLESMKKMNRCQFLRRILSKDDTNLVQKLKSINMLDGVSEISKAWNDVDPITNINSWV